MKFELDEDDETLSVDGEAYEITDDGSFEVAASQVRTALLSDLPIGCSIALCDRVIGCHELYRRHLSGLAAGRLELEITETVLMKNSEATLAALHRLRELGSRISMDDFGTGYSSLSYLRSFPFDKIKIDRSFIQDLAGNPGGKAIFRAIAALGTSLQMATTAEGVETMAQFAIVRAEGCTEVQGYLFGEPTPARNVREMLNNRVAQLLAAVDRTQRIMG